MKGALQRRWYAAAPAPLLLRPLAALYGAVSRARAKRLQREAVRLPVPVIVVGNISVGGTGKTPFAIWLLERLRDWGWTPGLVSRGYGGRAPRYPHAVGRDDDPRASGDEPLLIARRTDCPVVVGADRVAAARLLLHEHPEIDLIVGDDGLQHYRLARDLEICVVDGARGLGNGALLPAGPLREPPARLAAVDLVAVNGEGWQWAGALRMDLRMAAPRRLVDDARRELADFRGGRVHAVAGIGHPARFFAALRAAGLAIEAHAFADHHPYAAADFEFGDDAAILMTEKDAVKCGRFADPRLWAVPVTAELAPADAERVRECTAKLRRPQRS